MDRQFERIIKHLRDLAEILNLYDSEAVQITIVEKAFPIMLKLARQSISDSDLLSSGNGINHEGLKEASKGKKGSIKIGKLLQDLINNGYFRIPRALAEITEALTELSDKSVQTTQLSGYMLSLVNSRKLMREKSNSTGRFVYIFSESKI